MPTVEIGPNFDERAPGEYLYCLSRLPAPKADGIDFKRDIRSRITSVTWESTAQYSVCAAVATASE